jgi:dienelactone hydrolase
MWERFLKEGYVVVVADYRAVDFSRLGQPLAPNEASYVDDGVSVVEYVKKIPEVDPKRVTLYGVSLGGDVAITAASRTAVHSVILGAPAVLQFLGLRLSGFTNTTKIEFDTERAAKNIAPIQAPILILVGTKDFLLNADHLLHDQLEKAGKSVRLEIFENGYHDFVMGPQGHENRDEPLMDITLAALELALKFAKTPSNRP